MSKHTTPPVYPGGLNSHTRGRTQPIGNWNSHAKRQVPSRFRTPGRWERYVRRCGGPDHLPTSEQRNAAHFGLYD